MFIYKTGPQRRTHKPITAQIENTNTKRELPVLFKFLFCLVLLLVWEEGFKNNEAFSRLGVLNSSPCRVGYGLELPNKLGE